jgi:hypothetical protein
MPKEKTLIYFPLGFIIAAIAMILGINLCIKIFGQSNEDAIRNYALNIASNASAMYMRSGYSYEGLTLKRLGIDSTDANGTYRITQISKNELEILAIGRGDRDEQSATIKIINRGSNIGKPVRVNR